MRVLACEHAIFCGLVYKENPTQSMCDSTSWRVGPQGLDYVVAMAPRYGMRVILTLTNFPPGYGGMEQYVRWFNGSSIMDFYTNPAIVEAFKAYVEFVITRVNALTGIPYAEDPAILAWDLCNEPQAPGDDSGDILQVVH